MTAGRVHHEGESRPRVCSATIPYQLCWDSRYEKSQTSACFVHRGLSVQIGECRPQCVCDPSFPPLEFPSASGQSLTLVPLEKDKTSRGKWRCPNPLLAATVSKPADGTVTVTIGGNHPCPDAAAWWTPFTRLLTSSNASRWLWRRETTFGNVAEGSQTAHGRSLRVASGGVSGSKRAGVVEG